LFDDIYDKFHSLYKFYDEKIEVSGILVCTFLLTLGVFAIWIDDSHSIQIDGVTYHIHQIPDNARFIIMILVIAQMYGLYAYSRRKKKPRRKT
jgi:hypothetical protein